MFCTHDQGLSFHVPDRVVLLASVLLAAVTKVENVPPAETVEIESSSENIGHYKYASIDPNAEAPILVLLDWEVQKRLHTDGKLDSTLTAEDLFSRFPPHPAAALPEAL